MRSAKQACASRAKPAQETTLVAPPAIGAIAGKSTIVATVIDALTDQPVAGAPVTADQSTSPTQTRNTGNDGKVIFAGLEPSALSTTDPKYKYRLTVGLADPWVTHPDSVPAQAQQHLAAGVIVRVDEAGHHGHGLGVERLRVPAGQALDVAARPDGREAAAGRGERLGTRHPRVHRVDLGVDDDEIGILAAGGLRRSLRGFHGSGELLRAGDGGKRRARRGDEGASAVSGGV